MPPSLQSLVDAHPDCETFRFGDSKALCDTILALVRKGHKTATVEAKRVYDSGEDALPVVGRRDIALEWDGRPALMIESVEVRFVRFDQMDEAMVAAQGEFRDLAEWRKVYRAYFKHEGGWSEDMMLMFETFRVVQDYG